jgi:S-adenosylmethionine hydrolase
VITLLTDFGLEDGYVGAMKGVLAALAPGALVVDITHAVPPQDVRRGGLIWRSSVPYFPRGSIHVGVIDPGVGSRRRLLAFETAAGIFLAPDNGLVGYVLERRAVRRAVEVKRAEHFLPRVSATFHGRDIFAPVAARLATGLPLEALGREVRSYAWEGLPRPRRRWSSTGRGRRLREEGSVLDIDRFGNAMTNLVPRGDLVLEELVAGKVRFTRLARTYSDVPPGKPVALVGSLGFIEVAVHRGSAASTLALHRGERVAAVWRRRR